MTRLTFLSPVVAGLLVCMLAACTSFAPVYGDRSGTDVQTIRFNFAPPDTRLEQLIINRLRVAFPGAAAPTDPVLDIAATVSSPAGAMSNAIAVGRPVNVRIEATVKVNSGPDTLFSATRFSDTTYQSGKLTPVGIASADGARETAAHNVAEALRAAILAGYRP